MKGTAMMVSAGCATDDALSVEPRLQAALMRLKRGQPVTPTALPFAHSHQQHPDQAARTRLRADHDFHSATF